MVIKAIKQKGLLDIFTLAALFGPSFLFIKIAVQDISPITLVSLRVGIAGLLLLLILKLKGTPIPRDLKLWRYCLILGFFINGLPFICFCYSLTLIPSSLSALINAMTPVLTVFLANTFLQDERLTWNRLLGVLLGFTGFAVLFLPALFQSEVEMSPAGILLSFLGATCYAIGAVYARRFSLKAPPLVIPTLQLLTTCTYLLPLAFIFEMPLTAFDAPLTSWAAVFGLAIFGSMLAFIMYHRIVTKHGATAVSMATYLLPIFGAILGVTFLQETIGISFIFAALLIFSGIGVANGMIPFPLLHRRISES